MVRSVFLIVIDAVARAARLNSRRRRLFLQRVEVLS